MVGAQGVGQYQGVETVVLLARREIAVAEAVQLSGAYRVHVEAAFLQALHHRSVRGLDGDSYRRRFDFGQL